MAPDGRAQHFDSMDNCGKICWLMPRKLGCFADIGLMNAPTRHPGLQGHEGKVEKRAEGG